MSSPHKCPYPGAEPCFTREQAEAILGRSGLTVEQFCVLMDDLQEATLTEMDDIAWSMEEVMRDG